MALKRILPMEEDYILAHVHKRPVVDFGEKRPPQPPASAADKRDKALPLTTAPKPSEARNKALARQHVCLKELVGVQR